MAVIALAFEIDSEVYPELHAALSAMASDGSRGERLRQLAATGLVWEAIRIRGLPAAPTAARPEHVPATPEGTAEVPAEIPAEAAVEARSGADVAVQAAGVAPVRRGAVPVAPPLDFIDLALDAPPEGERPSRQPPVLFDVVEPDRVRTPWTSAGPLMAPADAADPPPPPEPVERPEPPASRSRLLRMKDRGLFRNG
ncbi:hypothetical protein [Aquabacterium sp.]|uniref:hypothetical protein n=1 Tax=Aquabacterium sp. TaxID=1872578 RepID=UPI002BBC9AFF|nr:hypothetical protein [Aquabacterium sp.]HSW05234.1 hypothetical protein [Aquabacterium sp.]